MYNKFVGVISKDSLTNSIKEAEKAHGIYEKETLNGAYDKEWANWYADFMIKQLPELGNADAILKLLKEAESKNSDKDNWAKNYSSYIISRIQTGA